MILPAFQRWLTSNSVSMSNRGNTLKISIAAKHGQLGESVQQTIHRKIEKLPRFFDRTTGADVVVDLADTDNPRVELKVFAEETDDFFAADSGSNIIKALDSVVHKVERQLRKHKEKLTDHRGARSNRDGVIENTDPIAE